MPVRSDQHPGVGRKVERRGKADVCILRADGANVECTQREAEGLLLLLGVDFPWFPMVNQGVGVV